MTPEKMMQHVQEKTGRCWHDMPSGLISRPWKCKKCGKTFELFARGPNPDPNDLNALLPLARKLKIRLRITTNYDGAGSCLVEDVGGTSRAHMPTEAEAIREVLYQATGGTE